MGTITALRRSDGSTDYTAQFAASVDGRSSPEGRNLSSSVGEGMDDDAKPIWTCNEPGLRDRRKRMTCKMVAWYEGREERADRGGEPRGGLAR